MDTMFRTDTDATATAWSSSPLGDPTFDHPRTETVAKATRRDDDRDRRAKIGPLALFATACVIAGGGAAGATLLGSPTVTTVVAPGVTSSDLAPFAPPTGE